MKCKLDPSSSSLFPKFPRDPEKGLSLNTAALLIWSSALVDDPIRFRSSLSIDSVHLQKTRIEVKPAVKLQSPSRNSAPKATRTTSCLTFLNPSMAPWLCRKMNGMSTAWSHSRPSRYWSASWSDLMTWKLTATTNWLSMMAHMPLANSWYVSNIAQGFRMQNRPQNLWIGLSCSLKAVLSWDLRVNWLANSKANFAVYFKFFSLIFCRKVSVATKPTTTSVKAASSSLRPIMWLWNTSLIPGALKKMASKWSLRLSEMLLSMVVIMAFSVQKIPASIMTWFATTFIIATTALMKGTQNFVHVSLRSRKFRHIFPSTNSLQRLRIKNQKLTCDVTDEQKNTWKLHVTFGTHGHIFDEIFPVIFFISVSWVQAAILFSSSKWLRVFLSSFSYLPFGFYIQKNHHQRPTGSSTASGLFYTFWFPLPFPFSKNKAWRAHSVWNWKEKPFQTLWWQNVIM